MELPKNYLESLKKIDNLDISKLQDCYNKNSFVGVRFNLKKLFLLSQDNQNTLQNDVNFSKNDDFFAKATDFLTSHNFDGNLSPVLWCKNGFYYTGTQRLGKSIFHELGLYYLQEPSAMAPIEFLGVKPTDVVLDLCASPGGKSTQIAQKLDGGFLVANEIIPSRAKVLAENIQRLGCDNVVVINQSPKDLETRFLNFFDKILVDAPCSGEGMFRRSPEACNEWQENSPNICKARQIEIVQSAYKMLKPNGTMVYSTCTFSLEENEEVIKFILDTFSDMEIMPVNHTKFKFAQGNDIDGSGRLKNTARLYPYLLDGEGHFFAVLHKKAGTATVLSKQAKNIANKHDVALFEKFAKENGLTKKFENYVSMGSYLYGNCAININKLKVVCPGVELGEIKKDIFIPSYHLAKCLSNRQFKNVLEVSSADAIKYMSGQEILASCNKGWVLLVHNNLPIAFGKVVDGKVKNHYPKTLRKQLA